MKSLIILLGALIGISAPTPNQNARFEIIFDDEKIGHVLVTEQKDGAHTIRDLKTNSDTRVIAISVHVESEAKITRNEHGVLIEGIGYRHANRGSEDVHAHTRHLGTNKYKVDRNGKSWVLDDHPIQYCVADMYFKEPVGMNKVYSNMYGANLKIAKLKDGRYHVITPDNKDSYYTYHGGKLMLVEVHTPLGKVITRRV